MGTPANRPQHDDERDLIDAIPGLERVTTSLQRSAGPSCFFSLIISALIIIILRRYFKLPLPGMVVLTFVIWWAVLIVLVRFGSPGYEDE